jgi:hypothetical protein
VGRKVERKMETKRGRKWERERKRIGATNRLGLSSGYHGTEVTGMEGPENEMRRKVSRQTGTEEGTKMAGSKEAGRCDRPVMAPVLDAMAQWNSEVTGMERSENESGEEVKEGMETRKERTLGAVERKEAGRLTLPSGAQSDAWHIGTMKCVWRVRRMTMRAGKVRMKVGRKEEMKVEKRMGTRLGRKVKMRLNRQVRTTNEELGSDCKEGDWNENEKEKEDERGDESEEKKTADGTEMETKPRRRRRQKRRRNQKRKRKRKIVWTTPR